MKQRYICKMHMPLIGIILLLTFCMTEVSAQVITTTGPTGAADAVYVAGNPDFYPIEYYN